MINDNNHKKLFLFFCISGIVQTWIGPNIGLEIGPKIAILHNSHVRKSHGTKSFIQKRFWFFCIILRS